MFSGNQAFQQRPPTLKMTDFSSLAIDLLSVKVSDFHAGCLDNDFSFCSRHKFLVRGTIPNLRHTYHCYWCQETTSGVDFFLLVQAHIEAFFSAKTGIIYRSPDCYLAKAHKSDELVQDLQAAISSIDGDTATTPEAHQLLSYQVLRLIWLTTCGTIFPLFGVCWGQPGQELLGGCSY